MWSAALLGLLLAPQGASDWPGWRGPGGNGVAADARLPLRWGPGHNVRWRQTLAGEGSSSPVVHGRRLYLTASLQDGCRRLVLAFDRDTGRPLWTHELADDNPERSSAVAGWAAPTPATDGERVVAVFGNAGVVCLDAAGRRLWHRPLGPFESELGLASSPLLAGGRVFLVCDHDGDRFTSFDSFLLALDAGTGRELWHVERRGLGRSWATPLLVDAGLGRQELIVSGQDEVRGHDPETGRLLWREPGLSGWVAPSPVAGLGLVFATSGRDGAVLALRPGPLPPGAGRVVWKQPRGGPYVPSPLLYGDFLYVPHETGFLSCFEARTGRLLYRERLGGAKVSASPVGGAGRVYLTNEAGVTFVVRAGPRFEVLARNDLGEGCWASPACADGLLFLRTERHLWCLGPDEG
jgi:outer membrane protein assembly factor BamB